MLPKLVCFPSQAPPAQSGSSSHGNRGSLNGGVAHNSTKRSGDIAFASSRSNGNICLGIAERHSGPEGGGCLLPENV